MNTPDLRLYDWVVISTSAGKDSQAMTDVVVEQAREASLLNRIVLCHCDLGEEEWRGTRELAEEHAKHYGVRFEVVKRKQGGILQHVLDRHEKLKKDGKTETAPWPSSEQRWCTSDHKRGQVEILFTKLANETRKGVPPCRQVRILSCMGMRAAESPARAKLVPFRRDDRNTNSRREVDIWLPLHSWSVDQVWARCKQAGTKVHYAYALGMPRLSCCFCIFAPKAALMLAGKHNPELLDKYVQVEKQVGFAFRVGLPLVEVQEALRRGDEPGEVRTWEM